MVDLRRGRAKVYHHYSYPECLDSVTNCHSVADHSLTSYWRAINQAQVERDLVREGVVGNSVESFSLYYFNVCFRSDLKIS